MTDRPDPPEKITIDKMIVEVINHLATLERDVYFFEQEPDKCNPEPARRRVRTFQQILSTLELVELHEAGFVNLIKAARPSRRK